MTQIKADILTRCINAFKVARMTIVDAIEKLYEVHRTEVWKGKYSSWSEFVEDGLQISRSTASKYIQTYEYYVVKGDVSPRNFQTADTEKLYLLIDFKGSPEEKLAMAQTLSRAELRENANEDHPHQHTPISICSKCSKRL